MIIMIPHTLIIAMLQRQPAHYAPLLFSCLSEHTTHMSCQPNQNTTVVHRLLTSEGLLTIGDVILH